MVKRDVIKAFLVVLNDGVSIQHFNHAHIALIPKLKKLTFVGNYRLISLCNIVYKIITKTMANRLKSIFLKIIDDSQSAFALGRLIIDNIIVTFETLHSLHKRHRGKKSFMVLKLYKSKAYDKVE